MINSKFFYIESSQIPLTAVVDGDLKANMLDPTTGELYKGIVLQGCFADLSGDKPNNNNRYYDIPTYLEMCKILKKQIFSPKGVYGELEHPKGYAVNSNNVSHKILDIWYNEEEKKVYGVVLLLDTINGKNAQQIIRSGGQLAVSARAGGEEVQRPDGSFDCKIKLLVTFDLVYHPGFSDAVLAFKQLNESQQFLQDISKTKTGFSGIIFEKDYDSIDSKYNEYIALNESDKCFQEWLLNDLNEASKKVSKEEKATDKVDEKKIENNESPDEEKIQNKLKKASDSELKESKQKFFEEVSISQKKLRKKQGNSYYQGSAGFITEGQDKNYFRGLDNNGFTY
jgi:hypothetical protein